MCNNDADVTTVNRLGLGLGHIIIHALHLHQAEYEHPNGAVSDTLIERLCVGRLPSICLHVVSIYPFLRLKRFEFGCGGARKRI